MSRRIQVLAPAGMPKEIVDSMLADIEADWTRAHDLSDEERQKLSNLACELFMQATANAKKAGVPNAGIFGVLTFWLSEMAAQCGLCREDAVGMFARALMDTEESRIKGTTMVDAESLKRQGAAS